MEGAAVKSGRLRFVTEGFAVCETDPKCHSQGFTLCSLQWDLSLSTGHQNPIGQGAGDKGLAKWFQCCFSVQEETRAGEITNDSSANAQEAAV